MKRFLATAVFFAVLIVSASSAAAGNLGEQLLRAAEKGHADVVRALLKKGAAVNARDAYARSTPLMSAIMYGRTAVARILLDKGADVNAKDIGGYTALHWAALGGYAGVVRLLIDKGANVYAQDNHGMTALDVAAEHDKIAVVRVFLEKGTNVNAKDGSDYTPLMWAAIAGKARAVRALLKGGADVNARCKFSGFTALTWAARKGHADVVRVLLDKGADVNAKDNSGHTPLYWAKAHGKTDVAQILKEAGGGKDVAQASSPPAAHAPEGFLGIHWGANREQIIGAMRERGFTTQGTIPNSHMPPSTLLFKGNFGGENCQLEFYLKNNTFYLGVANYLGMFATQPVQERIYREMVSRIGQKYGPPRSDKIDASRGNDGKIYRGGTAEWVFHDNASSEKYGIRVDLWPDGFQYFSHWDRTFGFVKITYTDFSLEERLRKKDF